MNFVDKNGTTKVYIPVRPWSIDGKDDDIMPFAATSANLLSR